MRALSARDLVRAWEWGEDRNPVDRALVLLGLALPEWRREDLAALPLGRRDGLLLQLRGLTLGPKLEIFVSCAKCRNDLEFTVSVADLVVRDPMLPSPEPFEVAQGAEWARCRVPNSLDVAGLAGVSDRTTAWRLLLRRCVVSAERDGADLPAAALSDDALAVIAARITEEDPQAVIRFDVACPTCGHAWAADLDVIAYFWEEISSQVRRLCREVHQLAHEYAWSERDILAMSPARRRWYLDMLE